MRLRLLAPGVPPVVRLGIFAMLGGTMALAPSAASGQAPGVRAYVTPGNAVGVGRAFVLNVELTGTQNIEEEPTLPDLSAFAQYLGSSTQSSVQMINGRTSVSVTIQYRYQALVEGDFEIPAFQVRAGGSDHGTDPIDITVSSAPQGQPDSGGPTVSEGDLFITAEPSLRTVYDGQPFTVEYRIWTRVDVNRFGMTSVPEPEGFWVEEVTPSGQPQVEQRTRDGVQYATAVVRRVALVPTGAGSRTVEPIGVEAQVRVRGGRDPFDDVFGRRSIFGSSTVPANVLSDELTIDVRPLPSGAPPAFTGLVGRLDATAALDRDSVATNEAVTLTVRVEGRGNLRALMPPELGLADDFEVFPPEVSESVRPTGDGLGGSKTFEYVVIPRAPGLREIPSLAFGYFDPDAETYRTATTAPIDLTVSGTVVDGPDALARRGVAQLREDIRFIRLGPLDLRRSGSGLVGPLFWLLLVLPLSAVAGAVVLRRHRDLLEGDLAYARGRRAGKVARKRLAEARDLASVDDPRPFYAEVARALRGFVSDRLDLAEAGARMQELDRALGEADVDEETRSAIRACLETCDRQRFAPPAADADDRVRILDQAGDLMTTLDRVLP